MNGERSEAFGHIGGDRPDKPSDKMHLISTVEYDGKEGVLRTFGGGIEELVQVRARLQEDILRQAVIVELEKLGYTVISPEEEDQ